jgi:hypothetical protein
MMHINKIQADDQHSIFMDCLLFAKISLSSTLKIIEEKISFILLEKSIYSLILSTKTSNDENKK